MKLWHFTREPYDAKAESNEAIILVSEDHDYESQEDAAPWGMTFKAEYDFEGDDWPIELPTDTDLYVRNN